MSRCLQARAAWPAAHRDDRIRRSPPCRRRRNKPPGAQKPEMVIVDIYLLLTVVKIHD